MKKTTFISTFFIILLFTISLASADEISASENVISTYTEYLSDNYYQVITISEIANNNGSALSPLSTASSKTVSKSSTIYNNGTAVAKFTLTASFYYNGSTSHCTSAIYSTTVYNSNWRFTDAFATYLGNAAKGSYVISYFSSNTIQKTYKESIYLSCDINGNIS